MVKVGRSGELEDGTMKEVLVKGREVLLARIGGSYYAADNRCPHRGGKLSQGKLGKKLAEDFGSYEDWEKDFKATGAMRGIGWAILYQDNTTGKLINQWINEHETGHLAGCLPILVMDVFEHAFITDYGLKRADYIEAFFKNINWDVVESRLK